MKQLKNLGFLAGFLILIAFVILGGYGVSKHFFSAQDATAKAAVVDCKVRGASHVVLIQNDKPNPQHTNGKLCETLTITNADNEIRLMAFGPHENHQPYDGITEKVLGPNQSFTVVLNEVGTYHFHDHIHDEVTGDFTVSK